MQKDALQYRSVAMPPLHIVPRLLQKGGRQIQMSRMPEKGVELPACVCSLIGYNQRILSFK